MTFGLRLPKLIVEPTAWSYSTGPDRREPVIDPEDGRIIRLVGYRSCMCCQEPFFSRDVRRVRLCDPCKLGSSFDGRLRRY